MDLSKVVFLDTETTSLKPDGEIWELAFELDGKEFEYKFAPQRWDAVDPMSLKIGRFYERTFPLVRDTFTDPTSVVPKLAARLAGRHIVGNVPSFDEGFLKPFFRANGAVLTTHYHLIDIENLIVGYLLNQGKAIELPWNSEDLSRAIGVEPNDFDRHTAMGDVRWLRAQWKVLTGQ